MNLTRREVTLLPNQVSGVTSPGRGSCSSTALGFWSDNDPGLALTTLCVSAALPAAPRGLGGQAGNGNDRAAVPGKGSQPELSGSHSQSHLVSPGENMRGSHFLSRLAFALSHSFFFFTDFRASFLSSFKPSLHLLSFNMKYFKRSRGRLIKRPRRLSSVYFQVTGVAFKDLAGSSVCLVLCKKRWEVKCNLRWKRQVWSLNDAFVLLTFSYLLKANKVQEKKATKIWSPESLSCSAVLWGFERGSEVGFPKRFITPLLIP